MPTNLSAGAGVVIVKYNATTKNLKLIGNYAGLSAPITASHIHRGEPGVPGPVIAPLDNTGDTTGVISGSATLTQSLEDSLLAGNTYANVHDSIYPGGELRAQLTQTTLGETEFFTGRLQGAQQVPPNSSTATGSVTALLDKGSQQVFVTGSFTGLTADAIAAHVHRHPPGAAGPVNVALDFSPATSGTVWGNKVVSGSFIDSMLAGNSYVNIHTSTYPDGEIRGQLTRLSQARFLKAVLSGSKQVPPNASAAKGTVIVKYDPESKVLDLVGDYQNLAAAISGSHIHSPAPPDSNANVRIFLNNTGGTSGVLSVQDTLTDTDESELLSGLMYVNVHNATYPGGEIRGQLTTVSDESQYFKGNFQGSQQVPPNSSTATGSVTVLLDQVTDEVFVTGDFHGLSAPASAGHIHEGAPGIAGPVKVPLSVTPDTSGTITGTGTITPEVADSMVRGFTYVNIHNSLFPGGEIRAQLGDLVLPVTLKYFNGYKQNNKVALIWESAQEQNLKQYEIQQQGIEPGVWISKGIVAANGGNTATKYSFLDVPVINKTNYVIYRLKMTDNDGRFAYSPVVRINFVKSKAELIIAANPVMNGQLRYIITGLSADRKAEVTVVDFSGRILVRTTASSLSNNNINVAGLPAGMYKLIVRVDENILQQSFAK